MFPGSVRLPFKPRRPSCPTARDRSRDKADPATGLILADDNRIIDNVVRGHKDAAIVVAGPDTVAEGNVTASIPVRSAAPERGY